MPKPTRMIRTGRHAALRGAKLDHLEQAKMALNGDFDRGGLMTGVLPGRPRNVFRHQDGRLFTEEALPNNLEATLCVERFCRHR